MMFRRKKNKVRKELLRKKFLETVTRSFLKYAFSGFYGVSY